MPGLGDPRSRDGVEADATDAPHGHDGTGLRARAREDGAHSRGDAAPDEGRLLDGKVGVDRDRRLGGDDDEVAEAAEGEEARDRLAAPAGTARVQDEPVRTEGGPPREALAAGAARRLDRERDPGADGQPLDALADSLDLAAALVAEHDRRGVRVSRRRDVGVADAGCEHPHPYLARAGPRYLDVLEPGNLSEALEHERADGFGGRHGQPVTTSGSEQQPAHVAARAPHWRLRRGRARMRAAQPPESHTQRNACRS